MSKSTYSTSSRSARMSTAGFTSMDSVREAFTQDKVREIHKDMDPKHIRLREARDSDVHPLTYPAMFILDVTGSMLDIPKKLMLNGLPKIVTAAQQAGIESPAIMFGAVGDSVMDKAPLQIGQFESGDAEMDKWLTQTWLEGGGGANAGESYPWAWYFAANHVVTDAWEKRHQKCLLVTCGDEPFLPIITKSEFERVMGMSMSVQSASLNASELYKAACEKFDVFHIHINHTHRRASQAWKDLMGQNLIEVETSDEVPGVFSRLMIENCKTCKSSRPTGEGPRTEGDFDDGPRYAPEDEEEPIL